uniref:Protein kinase domain-containing protein n=1 Tax=Globisporangium ultimum (strain ATCC 200006 / CBS 805.95 / DAOM BR144) TaxID=431595 RepID=K3XCM1_GLOUD
MKKDSHVALVSALVLASLAMPTVVDAVNCTSLTQNTLTSVGCPTDCASYPCVLYSPSQPFPCSDSGGAVGACTTLADFTLPNGDTCDVTYQCLDKIMYENRRWVLALSAIADAGTVSQAYVTEIKQLKYDTSNTQSVQLTGRPTGSTKRGDMKNILLDQTFFDMPTVTTAAFLMHVNLRNILKERTLSKAIVTLSLINVNMDTVPDTLAGLPLQNLDLSKNYLSSLPNATSVAFSALSSVSVLNVADNSFVDFTTVLPALTSLNLSGNPLTTIPTAVFDMNATLKTLSMIGCNLTNLQLTDAQFAFLDQLSKFEGKISLTQCADGYAAKDLQNGQAGQVCIASASTSKGSSSTIPIILGVVGGALVLCLIATGTSSIWNDPELLAVRIDHKDVEAIKLLSRGGFGEVWLGLYMNENVAIKRLLSDKKSMDDALAFASEIRIMARLEHPKIVRFIGVSWTNYLTIQAVTEFMDCGDLKSLLDSNRASSLTWANLKCQISIDIADALVYLHTLNPKLIHRDLKSRNVLIDAQTGAKLSDFGISRDRSVEETMTAGVGTARWIAPEVVLGGHYTEAADIYSFGVVLSELDTCKAPFHDATNTNGAKMQDVTILQLVSAGKLQPSFTDLCPPAILKLARACLEFDPARRPNAIHISYELRKIMKDEL